MDIGYFTYITGIASLLGLLLQVFDIFKEHKQLRNSASLLTAGVFLGSIIGALDTSTIKVDISFGGYEILVAIAIIILTSAVLYYMITNDDEKQVSLLPIIFGGTIGLFMLLTFGASRGKNNDYRSHIDLMNSKLTVGELLVIAETNETNQDYDRAIMHLENAQQRLKVDDPRKQALTEKIDTLKIKQIK